MHWLSPFFSVEVKFGPPPQKKKIKKPIDINRDETFQNSRLLSFWPQKEWRNFGRDESRTSWRETKKIQIKFAKTCNNNEQQQDAKNNA